MSHVDEKINELVREGYFLLKNVVPCELVDEIKNVISHELVHMGAYQEHTFEEQYLTLFDRMNPYDLNKKLMRMIVASEMALRILRIPEVLNCLVKVIGADLAYETSCELPVSVQGIKNDSLELFRNPSFSSFRSALALKQSTESWIATSAPPPRDDDSIGFERALLVKKFHQEFWSGAGYRSFVVWAPMVLPEGAGTLELIKKSHTWGHIPHCNREPTQLPNDAESVIVDCHEGDLLIFHSLTLHRTVPNPDIS